MTDANQLSGAPVEGLPTANSLTGDEWLYLIQGGNSRKVNLDDVKSFFDAQGIEQIRLPVNGNASLTSTIHPFQIGETDATNLIMDSNEIQARHNGNATFLSINKDGGRVTLGDHLYLEHPVPQIVLRDTDATDLNSALMYLNMQTGSAGGHQVGGLLGMISNTNNHLYIRPYGINSQVLISPNNALTNYRFADGYLDFDGNNIFNIGDPVHDNHVGDRGYNDARYNKRFHMSTLIETPISGKSYWISRQLPQDVNFDQVVVHLNSGSCTVTVDVNGVALGNFAATAGETVININPHIDGLENQAVRVWCSSLVSPQDLTVDLLGDYR